MTMAEHLDARSRRILSEVIKSYIVTGEPVGSRTISKRSGMNLSPATVRNVMADLVEIGLLASRIPLPAEYQQSMDFVCTWIQYWRWRP